VACKGVEERSYGSFRGKLTKVWKNIRRYCLILIDIYLQLRISTYSRKEKLGTGEAGKTEKTEKAEKTSKKSKT
jgi:hypothetical protein